ncbi:histidine phosphatase family protein [Nakamurella sp. YIM 132087]|uniref:Histidine phosphatase family protein n=1 Tax=Nakamurella alba TaxID=2665158 RepID=A0A7K1FHS9_9ACTN|nr:histidine phosphatase family protein [Nakamurella alba]MTD12999.1 histidine phosphatase family protein [Nakamurella alba]
MSGPRIALIRHGQTEWSASGQHTSTTDIDLTAEGVQQAGAVAGMLTGLELAPRTVLVSPRLRARRTAELAGLTPTAVLDDLAEWDYGSYEGLTSAQIHQDRPGWSIFTDGAPGGESPEQTTARADRALAAARAALADGDVALVCHGHISRVLAVRWVGLPVATGSLLAMSPAAITVLGTYRGDPIIDHANVVPFVGGPA